MKGRIAGKSLALLLAALIVAPQVAYAEGEATCASAIVQAAGKQGVMQTAAVSDRAAVEMSESAGSADGDLAYAAELDAAVSAPDAGAATSAGGLVDANGYSKYEGVHHVEEAPLMALGQASEGDSLLSELLPEWVIPLVFASAGIAVVVCLYRLQETMFPRESGEPEQRW